MCYYIYRFVIKYLGFSKLLFDILIYDNLLTVLYTLFYTSDQAERQAVNTTIQGSAADIAKKAMVTVLNHFRNNYSCSDEPKLVLHLHDELLFEVPLHSLIKVAKVVKECMEHCIRLSVPLPVKMKSGLSWGEMQEFIL